MAGDGGPALPLEEVGRRMVLSFFARLVGEPGFPPMRSLCPPNVLLSGRERLLGLTDREALSRPRDLGASLFFGFDFLKKLNPRTPEGLEGGASDENLSICM